VNARAKTAATLASVVTFVLIAAGLLALRTRGALRLGEEGARVYFYDQSETRLYAVPRDTIPPDAGTGGEVNDGVRAVVVACRSDPAKQQIAYLVTYTPELKQVLEDVRAARQQRRPYNGQTPACDDPFFVDNTLVRRPDDANWYAASSAAGEEILSGWRDQGCPGNETPVVCTP
jgi:hypothetical protein